MERLELASVVLKTDLSKHGYFKPSDKAVLSVIAAHVNDHFECIGLSRESIGNLCGLSKFTVSRSLSRLKDTRMLNVVNVENPELKARSVYSLCFHFWEGENLSQLKTAMRREEKRRRRESYA